MGENLTTKPAPWKRLAAEARWRILTYLPSEKRHEVRAILREHVRRLDAVLRQGRAA